jgi:hypothetical protein
VASRADNGDMTPEPDQPWRVFARRPAPLAGLFQSESERLRGNRVQAQAEPVASLPDAVSPSAPSAADPS